MSYQKDACFQTVIHDILLSPVYLTRSWNLSLQALATAAKEGRWPPFLVAFFLKELESGFVSCTSLLLAINVMHAFVILLIGQFILLPGGKHSVILTATLFFK